MSLEEQRIDVVNRSVLLHPIQKGEFELLNGEEREIAGSFLEQLGHDMYYFKNNKFTIFRDAMTSLTLNGVKKESERYSKYEAVYHMLLYEAATRNMTHDEMVKYVVESPSNLFIKMLSEVDSNTVHISKLLTDISQKKNIDLYNRINECAQYTKVYQCGKGKTFDANVNERKDLIDQRILISAAKVWLINLIKDNDMSMILIKIYTDILRDLDGVDGCNHLKKTVELEMLALMYRIQRKDDNEMLTKIVDIQLYIFDHDKTKRYLLFNALNNLAKLKDNKMSDLIQSNLQIINGIKYRPEYIKSTLYISSIINAIEVLNEFKNTDLSQKLLYIFFNDINCLSAQRKNDSLAYQKIERETETCMTCERMFKPDEMVFKCIKCFNIICHVECDIHNQYVSMKKCPLCTKN